MDVTICFVLPLSSWVLFWQIGHHHHWDIAPQMPIRWICSSCYNQWVFWIGSWFVCYLDLLEMFVIMFVILQINLLESHWLFRRVYSFIQFYTAAVVRMYHEKFGDFMKSSWYDYVFTTLTLILGYWWKILRPAIPGWHHHWSHFFYYQQFLKVVEWKCSVEVLLYHNLKNAFHPFNYEHVCSAVNIQKLYVSGCDQIFHHQWCTRLPILRN